MMTSIRGRGAAPSPGVQGAGPPPDAARVGLLHSLDKAFQATSEGNYCAQARNIASMGDMTESSVFLNAAAGSGLYMHTDPYGAVLGIGGRDL